MSVGANIPASSTRARQIDYYRLAVWTARLALVVALLLLWQWGYARAGRLFVAEPVAVVERLLAMALNGQLLAHTGMTLYVTFLGILIGCIFGIGAPFVLRLSPRATSAVEPFILASMGFPKLALAPLLILWFGIGIGPRLILVAFLTFYMMFIATFAGIRNVDRRLVSMAKVVGASERLISKEILWNTLLPFLFAALKVAIPYALSAAIVGEFLAAKAGIGYYIEQSRQSADTTGLFAGVVIVSVVVLALNMLVNAVQRRLLAWRPSDAIGGSH